MQIQKRKNEEIKKLIYKKVMIFEDVYMTYLKQDAILNECNYEINKEVKKSDYRIKINDNNIEKYYYIISTNRDETEYKNKDSLMKLLRRLNQNSHHNSKHIIITSLLQKDIEAVSISNSNIKLFGEEYLENILEENKVLIIKILSKYFAIEDLIDEINRIEEKEWQGYDNINRCLFLKDISDRDYNLVLGAGVSIDCDAKTWNEMLDLYDDKINKKSYVDDTGDIYSKVGNTSLIKAQLVKDIYDFNKKEYKYFETLHEGLYSKFNFGNNTLDKEKFILYHVARIMNKNRLKRNFRVISYNYDNYLEYFIENILEKEYRFSYVSLFKEETYLKDAVPIYHVHGFLPYTKHISKMNKKHMNSIILTESDYNNLYNDPYRWEITSQLAAYRENMCIFVGSSLQDPNIRRLIMIARKSNKIQRLNHYAIIKKENSISHTDCIVIEKHFSKIGIKIIWTDDYGVKILSKMY